MHSPPIPPQSPAPSPVRQQADQLVKKLRQRAMYLQVVSWFFVTFLIFGALVGGGFGFVFLPQILAKQDVQIDELVRVTGELIAQEREYKLYTEGARFQDMKRRAYAEASRHTTIEKLEFIDMFATHFVSESRGWAVGDNGTVLHTRDGGQNWSEQASGTDNRLYGVYFVNDQVGLGRWGITARCCTPVMGVGTG